MVPVPAALDGERLDRIVSLVVDVSRAQAADAVAAGHVVVDGLVERQRSRRLSTGQQVEVTSDIGAVPAVLVADADVVFDVVFDDGSVVVVDKPAGLVVHPGAGNLGGTLVNGLLARYPQIADVGDPARPGIVHRLDRGTSGLLVVALTSDAYDSLTAQLADRSVVRVYRAMTWGVPSAKGVIEAPIARSSRDPTRMAVVEGGRDARTRYETVREVGDGAHALVTCWLDTGRTHQIRVHLAAISRPVVGDEKYAPGRPTLGLQRPFLHAMSLGFEHPETGVAMTFESPLPFDLVECIARFE